MSKSANAEIAELRRRNPQLGIIDQTNARPPIALAPAEIAAALGMTGTGVEGALGAAPLEHDEQAALFAWASENEDAHPELALLFAVPNGGKLPYTRNAKGKTYSPQRIALVAEGMKAGVPDVCLPIARGRFHSLWIEMKRKPNKPTQEQLQWIDALRHYGNCACICYGAEEAISTIMAYLGQEGA